MRHEIKSRLLPAEAAALRVRLQAVMSRDPHVRPNGTYDIHSVYLDTPSRTALMEKRVGVPIRHKYRIRYYNDDQSFFRLERKSKVDTLCDKVGCTLSRPELLRLMAGDILWMADSDRPLVREVYLRMRRELMAPSVQVHYTREAYIYGPGNVRVTLDSNLRTGLWSPDFLDVSQPRPHTQSDDFVLLEVKFDGYLPEIIEQITRCRCRPMTFSKFEACHSYD